MREQSLYCIHAPNYIKKNIVVLPDEPKSHATYIKGWTNYSEEHPTKENYESWFKRKGCNISICLGKASNLTALDFDFDVDGLHDKIISLLPKGYCTKIGSKGFTAFFKYNGEKKQIWKKDNKVVVEIVNKTTIPPSIHPKGMTYKWGTDDLLSCYDNLPQLPEDFIEQLNKIFKVKEYMPPIKTIEYDSPTIDEIKVALSFISPDICHDDWIKIGMSIYNELDDKGFFVFDDWSKGSNKYKQGEMQSRWRSFKGTKVNIASLFYIAKQNGYVAPTTVKTKQKDDIIDWNSFLEIKKERVFPEDLLNAPRLVGKIKNWLDDVSVKKQPILSLSSAITAVGTIMSHRVASDSDLRTNMYCLSLAGSGQGKDHARKAIIELYRACGLSSLIRGTPTSGQGLLSALQGAGGCCLMQIDEIGEYLQGIQGKQTPKYLKDIMVYITSLFSSSNSIFYGQEYANKDGKMDREDIEQPCLNILGSTSQKTFFDSLTGKETANGFIARWLIFETEKRLPEDNDMAKDIKDIPEELIKKIKEIRKKPVNVEPKGDIDLSIRPRKIPFTEEAREILKEFKKEIADKRNEFIENDDPLESVFNRTVEHAIKLSLLASDGNVVDKKALMWAIKVSQYSSNKLAEAISENVYDNMQEMLVKRVFKTIKNHKKWITQSQLIRKTQYLKTRERTDIINDLITSDKIESDIETTTRKPFVKYKCKK